MQPLRRAVAVSALLLVGAGAGWASTNSNSMPATNRLAVTTVAVTPASFVPACTGSLTSITTVTSGATTTIAAVNTLILAANGNETVTAANGYVCFVGGGPAASNNDKFTGKNGSGSQCVVATSNPGGNNAKFCTIVQRTP